MSTPTRCLLVYPEFTSQSFWNYRATCHLVGAAYPAAPLGLITVAALLPASWQCRLVDRNVGTLTDADLAWADIVFTGGMIPQQRSSLALIERCQAAGKPVVVGGPDATSSPHLYDRADYQVLGEAEITLPRWLARLRGRGQRGTATSAGRRRPTSPRRPCRASSCSSLTATSTSGPVRARLPVPLRVLRHHRAVRPRAAPQDRRPDARRARRGSTISAIAATWTSSTTTSSATRRS